MSAAMGFFPKELKNEFETAVVNEPSVFEPMKFYCKCSHNFGLTEQDIHYPSVCKDEWVHLDVFHRFSKRGPLLVTFRLLSLMKKPLQNRFNVQRKECAPKEANSIL